MKRLTTAILIVACSLLSPRLTFGQEFFDQDEENMEYRDEERPSRDYHAELQRQRYKTALARERADQAYHEDRARLYESQREMRETYARRAEQERQYDQRSNQINTVNQATNAVAGAVRQYQVLSGRSW